MNQSERFYSSIADYYSAIFPFNPAQLNFVESFVGELAGLRLLDIGCATGELARMLARKGARVTAIDLNEDLLEQARRMAQAELQGTVAPEFRKGNMLELSSDFAPETFDLVLCFGNTLVHLPDTNTVAQMLKGVKQVLKPGGLFLLQILNYDHILDDQIKELPLIDNDKISFVRKYEFEVHSSVVQFVTELTIKATGECIRNRSQLLALRSAELTELLQQEGFRELELFANFKREPFGGKHLPLVLSCRT